LPKLSDAIVKLELVQLGSHKASKF
jgi:hypothetical protein